MTNQLEQLISEWLELKGYFIRRNVRVGLLPGGGYEGELDIVAYHPQKKRVLHIEASLDASSWEKREEHFRRKFEVGRQYAADILPWVQADTEIEQWAVLWGSNRNHLWVGGGQVIPVWDLYRKIACDVLEIGDPARRAIPEQFSLLRTMQLTLQYTLRKADRQKIKKWQAGKGALAEEE